MSEEMLRPPVNRAMRTLDKAFFKKEVLTSAARVPDLKQMSRILGSIKNSKDLCEHREFQNVRDENLVRSDDAAQGRAKCIVLHPKIKADGAFEDARPRAPG